MGKEVHDPIIDMSPSLERPSWTGSQMGSKSSALGIKKIEAVVIIH